MGHYPRLFHWLWSQTRSWNAETTYFEVGWPIWPPPPAIPERWTTIFNPAWSPSSSWWLPSCSTQWYRSNAQRQSCGFPRPASEWSKEEPVRSAVAMNGSWVLSSYRFASEWRCWRSRTFPTKGRRCIRIRCFWLCGCGDGRGGCTGSLAFYYILTFINYLNGEHFFRKGFTLWFFKVFL